MAVVIVDGPDSRRAIHGLCASCGYEIDWALLRS